MLGNWRHQWSANDPDYFDLGGRMTVAHRFSRRLTANGNASWHDRRYRTRKALDGPVRNLSLSAAWVVTPTVRLNATAGYGRDRPETVRYRNKSKWLQAGVSVALPRGFTVGGGGGVRWTDFEGEWRPNTPPGEFREDKTYNLRASVHNRALTFFGFSPEISVVHEVRKPTPSSTTTSAPAASCGWSGSSSRPCQNPDFGARKANPFIPTYQALSKPPPLPLGEGWGEGHTHGPGRHRPPLPLGEGWGEEPHPRPRQAAIDPLSLWERVGVRARQAVRLPPPSPSGRGLG